MLIAKNSLVVSHEYIVAQYFEDASALAFSSNDDLISRLNTSEEVPQARAAKMRIFKLGVNLPNFLRNV